ncbi:MAG: hypothetical protein HXY25_10860 [Alphaproteobacteria bacterium]|nr:hypothetical protein [Alphaproteobacteria bacterium]
MLFHASIPADEPERVARFLAALWRGRVLPFPVFARSFMAMAEDARGTEIEVTPRSLEQIPGPEEVTTRENPAPSPYGATHLALGSKLSEDEILTLAAREGWTARVCDRGGVFHVVEVWLENKFLIEVLTEAFQREYLAAMTFGRMRSLFETPPAGPA